MRTPFVVLALVASRALAAQAPLKTYADAFIQRYDRTAPQIDYTITVPESDRSAYHVALRIANAPGTLRLAIPAWAPGAYRLMGSGANIADLAATDTTGRSLPVTRADSLTWSVEAGAASVVVVTYTTAIRRAEEWARPNNRWFLRGHSGLIDGPRTFLYLDGWTLGPSLVTLRLPAGWEIGTGLVPTTDPMVYWAPSYDVLIDSPTLVGRFTTWRFTAAGVPHRVVVDVEDRPVTFDSVAFVDMLRRIAEAGIAVFGSAPYKDYTFIFAGAGGGLEHLNSTTIGINLERTAADPTAHEGVAAHEFFHAWNVKRIRPVELGPFDYSRPVRTLSLWISEGITDYYTDVLLVRAGLDTPADFVTTMERALASHRSNPARLTISPERSSWTTWDGASANGGQSLSYYLQGEVLGFALDLTIRDSTDGRASLDDVMRTLFDRYAGARGFAASDVLNVANAVCGCDLQDFWRRYVSGTAEVPWNNLLRAAGWRVEFTAAPRAEARGPRSPTLRARITDLPGMSDRARRIRDGLFTGR
jgi:predicted metalloprotease with PDZ domain